MNTRFDNVPNRRAIVDRRALAEEIAAIPTADRALLRRDAIGKLKDARDAGRG